MLNEAPAHTSFRRSFADARRFHGPSSRRRTLLRASLVSRAVALEKLPPAQLDRLAQEVELAHERGNVVLSVIEEQDIDTLELPRDRFT
jgi:hypothetical protein